MLTAQWSMLNQWRRAPPQDSLIEHSTLGLEHCLSENDEIVSMNDFLILLRAELLLNLLGLKPLHPRE
jgi:hypothetical protein